MACWGDHVNLTDVDMPAVVASGGQVAVAAGARHTCALSAGGAVACWGTSDLDQLSVPPAVAGGGQVAVAAGWYHTCALSAGGAVACWGLNEDGQTSVPGGVAGRGQVAVTAGGYHACALSAGGAVVCWGWNNSSQSDVPAVVAVGGQVAVAAGGYHTCALSAVGAVTCWGSDYHGQTAVPSSIAGGGQVALAAGEGHTCALSAGGAVACWGWNNYSQTTVPSSFSSGGVALPCRPAGLLLPTASATPSTLTPTASSPSTPTATPTDTLTPTGTGSRGAVTGTPLPALASAIFLSIAISGTGFNATVARDPRVWGAVRETLACASGANLPLSWVTLDNITYGSDVFVVGPAHPLNTVADGSACPLVNSSARALAAGHALGAHPVLRTAHKRRALQSDVAVTYSTRVVLEPTDSTLTSGQAALSDDARRRAERTLIESGNKPELWTSPDSVFSATVRVTYYINVSSVETYVREVAVRFVPPQPPESVSSKLSQFAINALITIATTLGGVLFGFLVKKVRDRHHQQADQRTHGVVASIRDRLGLAIAYGDLGGEAGHDLSGLLGDVALAAFGDREPPACASETFAEGVCNVLSTLAHPLDPSQAAVVRDRSVLGRIWTTTSVARWVYQHPGRPWVIAHVALAVSAHVKVAQPAVATQSMDGLAAKQAEALVAVTAQARGGDVTNPMLPHEPPPSNDRAQGISTAPERVTPAENIHRIPEWDLGGRGRRQTGRGAVTSAASGAGMEDDDGFVAGDSDDALQRTGILNPVRQSLSDGR